MAATNTGEEILEPDLPIVDPHHHLWDRVSATREGLAPASGHPFMVLVSRVPRYLLHELMADTTSGHKVRATVFLECRSMYRASGPENLRCVGETEFVNGVAAMTASGLYGDFRACAGIVGHTDFRQGDAVQKVLEEHMAAGHGRFRGIRQSASWDADTNVLGPLAGGTPGLYLDPKFRAGFKYLAKNGLSFDAWMLEPQLPDLVDLANAFSDTPIVLDHVGTPLGIASYDGKRGERFPIWRDNIRKLAKARNVFVKLGGLAMPFAGFSSFLSDPPARSETLAEEWSPYIEECIDAFGVDRCMFESNFPVDSGTCSYAVLWNTFKRIAANYSKDEKNALFSGTATRFYKLDI